MHLMIATILFGSCLVAFQELVAADGVDKAAPLMGIGCFGPNAILFES